jgi:hypothetical protein
VFLALNAGTRKAQAFPSPVAFFQGVQGRFSLFLTFCLEAVNLFLLIHGLLFLNVVMSEHLHTDIPS